MSSNLQSPEQNTRMNIDVFNVAKRVAKTLNGQRSERLDLGSALLLFFSSCSLVLLFGGSQAHANK